ncbi:hypothetical protein [Agrobacterium leguminum]|uniref:hypothetical protein n=1 Tax=Agrobacterium leguminum TaxID=2792015 RepID=UPI003CE45AFA
MQLSSHVPLTPDPFIILPQDNFNGSIVSDFTVEVGDKVFSPVGDPASPYKVVFDLVRWLQDTDVGSNRLNGLLESLRSAAKIEASDYASGNLVASDAGVAFAVLRRISRESAYLAAASLALVRECARVMRVRHSGTGRVIFKNAEDFDRPSLKFLCLLLLNLGNDVRWLIHIDPDGTTSTGKTSLFSEARADIFSKLVTVLRPGRVDVEAHQKSAILQELVDPIALASNIVLQNYDICLFHRDPPDLAYLQADTLRLKALAAVNIGSYAAALNYLDAAIGGDSTPVQRAACLYAKGLVLQKRLSDGDAAVKAFLRGLDALQGLDDEAARLERAWLFNGLALNDAIKSRSDKPNAGRHIAAAFSKLCVAQDLVAKGKTPADVYLRHNLLANTVLLAEMAGHYGQARRLFEKNFIKPESLDAHDSRTVTFGYRLGLLHLREGNIQQAEILLSKAAKSAEVIGCDYSLERILRAQGFLKDEQGSQTAAWDIHLRGLVLSDQIFSGEGCRHHVSALARIAETGDISQKRLVQMERERFRLSSLSPQVKPSPKLPAYFPEFDLEDVPSIDINRRLANV